MRISRRLEDIWYSNHPLSLMLLPLSWLYRGLVGLRRYAYTKGLLTIHRLSIPLIVVGNISVGGTGKTLLVIWLANFLKAYNYKPGIVARGYGGRAEHWPQQVWPDSDPAIVGDESVLLARRCHCPVTVSPNRWVAARALLKHHPCDVIISDDGLQHLRLGRDLEIGVIDGSRRHGNRRCLPAGPLREPVSRLNQVDLVVTNGSAGHGEFTMKCICQPPRSLLNETEARSLKSFRKTQVHAIAGIGHPERFFSTLRAQGIRVIPHAFPDHHPFSEQDIHFGDGLPVLMTEKDAVKCLQFAGPQHWYMPIEAQLPRAFKHRLLSSLKRK